jgi:hypothetical protein
MQCAIRQTLDSFSQFALDNAINDIKMWARDFEQADRQVGQTLRKSIREA